MSDGPLLPPIDEENESFWDGCRRGELRVQRCADTGRLIFPPRATSPWGRHGEPEWTTVSGRGRIWSFVRPHPPLLPYFAALTPYNVILVALDEDPSIRLTGNLVLREGGAINEIEPDAIRIGAPVRVIFEPLNEAIHLPRWIAV